ncbi:MAG: hypothetical protein ACREBC_31830, partial [Pyrinomonadaceae bacterium]
LKPNRVCPQAGRRSILASVALRHAVTIRGLLQSTTKPSICQLKRILGLLLALLVHLTATISCSGIAPNRMYEFRSNSGDFVRRTRRRVTLEISIILLLVGYFGSGWSQGIPGWLEVAIVSVFAASVLYDLAYYPKAKASADNFAIYLMDNALGFSDRGDIRQIPYRDLTVVKVSKKNGRVVAIHLRTTLGQSIKLQGLENIQELYEGIAVRIDHRT